jgi:formimidoylglutamate deiminase
VPEAEAFRRPTGGRRFHAEQALLPQGWARDVALEVDHAGRLTAVLAEQSPRSGDLILRGPVLPGMPALHSHAFQRAMAGLAEWRASDGDDFWHWREAMYRFAGRIGPEDARAIARWLYVELLEHGYTAVAEFHYIHRQPDGRPYARPAEMMLAHLGAARDAGIAFTALPVLYQWAGCDRRPLAARQQRFRSSPDEVLAIAAAVRSAAMADPDVRAGIAPHSLRAADLDSIRAAVGQLHHDTPDAPVHVHVAEQTREVEEVLAYHGRRPVALLAETVGLDARWCLVHATHVDAEELRAMAASAAVVGLCPSTEANLGDGLFPVEAYRAAGGRWGIGGDSHVCRDPAEELRLLEYGQRLHTRRRNRITGAVSAAVGTTLWLEACAGGAQALGQPMGELAPGKRADWLVLDPQHPDLHGHAMDSITNAMLFAAAGPVIDEVWVAGKVLVRGGRHPQREAALAGWRECLTRLMREPA